LDVRGFVALLGLRFVARLLFGWPLPMATRGLSALHIGVILDLIIITFGPLFLLNLFFFTSLTVR
jgi:hypothetical protein